MKNIKFAVFDVDNTILAFKSLFEFARFYCQQTQREDYPSFVLKIKTTAEESGRDAANRLFFQLFKGVELSELKQLVQQWTTFFQSSGWPLLTQSYQHLIAHQKKGHIIIWLSGSARLFIEPLAIAMDIDHILASELDIENGICTGQTTGPAVIGRGKLDQLNTLLQQLNLLGEQGIGYGDHYSDIDFLSSLQHARIIAGDTVLETTAKEKHWDILSDKFHYETLSQHGESHDLIYY